MLENLHLIRKEGQYYLVVDEEQIPIEEWQAMEIAKDHSLVYDFLAYRNRKHKFNATEDQLDTMP